MSLTRIRESLSSVSSLDGPPLRFLVVEGNPADQRRSIEAAGGTVGCALYAEVLRALAPPGSRCETVYPADPGGESLPRGLDWSQIDAVAWTGSALNVYDMTPGVTRQLDLSRAVFAAGPPYFGSCWALQIAAVAAGGTVEANPRGREIGLARKITLTEAGRDHPLYRGRPAAFDAVAIHTDIVTRPPPGCRVLAENAVTPIQAAEIRHDNGVFWGIQYHPEFDLFEVARLIARDAGALVAEGLFADEAAVARVTTEAEALTADPARCDLAWRLGVDGDVLDPVTRLIEVRNWIDHQVRPFVTGRRS
ncbi:type 1 glutamine amidotransferase [Rhodospira trueperi]|uniref:GMP synthase (Glutamine-hydrolysing) n=1 Tax=Rhodospira trueperi TaxID=69960 RepID=A0A1G6Z3A4_9PROT|nr:type 1 glutamine amidotransferase [Rhodospira trueperi]SDD97011.1 GMP synthase (glutamine-hydrolysing) [Rhodospira trueperi]